MVETTTRKPPTPITSTVDLTECSNSKGFSAFLGMTDQLLNKIKEVQCNSVVVNKIRVVERHSWEVTLTFSKFTEL